MSRLLSYTEISTALECFARWDFAYGGRLAGSTLKPRERAARLSGGSAWGAGIAAWHASGDDWAAYEAMWESLASDAVHARGKGFPIDPEQTIDQYEHLSAVFAHHAANVERLPGLSMLEGELNIPIPSRTGKRGSSRYRFHCYLDGHVVQDGHPWIVEFKLRDNLTPTATLDKQPQYRWYAVAYALSTGLGLDHPVGIYIDETLNVAPRAPKIVNSKRKAEGVDGKTVSHDVRQFTTPGRYETACQKYGTEPSPDTLAALGQRQWHQRYPLIFTPDELAEGAEDLRTAAKLIRDLDKGELSPIRNGAKKNCSYCKFVGICKEPRNDHLINNLFERTEPKRLRGPKPEGAR